MGRTNKTTSGVFTEIVGTETTHNSYDVFLKDEQIKSKILQTFLTLYKKSVTDISKDLDKLAMIEEIIMQLRSKERISDIKLSLVREYVYARCPFYRKGKTSKDIRVIINNYKNPNADLNELENNPEFMNNAKTLLVDAMENEIKVTINKFESTYNA